MSKRLSETTLKGRSAKRRTRGSLREEQKDLYRFVKNLDPNELPLLPDLKNILSEYLDPCDYITNPYKTCFLGYPPTVRDINIDAKFDTYNKCCRDRCMQLLQLVINPPTEFLLNDRITPVDLGIPRSVHIYWSNTISRDLEYDVKSNLFTSGHIMWSDLQTTCDELQTHWPWQRLSICYSRDWSLDRYHEITDRQYGLYWSAYQWNPCITLIGEA